MLEPNDTSNSTDNWNHLRINQEIPEQQNWKTWHQGTTDNSHTGHCTRASESTNVKAQKIYLWK